MVRWEPNIFRKHKPMIYLCVNGYLSESPFRWIYVYWIKYTHVKVHFPDVTSLCQVCAFRGLFWYVDLCHVTSRFVVFRFSLRQQHPIFLKSLAPTNPFSNKPKNIIWDQQQVEDIGIPIRIHSDTYSGFRPSSSEVKKKTPNFDTTLTEKGTLPETNIAPENRPLEKEIPIGNHHF